ncbi:hypothetical protein GGF49_006120 [Coemansia sp. RSA 1853]|nr:hypothetical protein GGF49_006120 [Coemansia sp. RSA 1853]
MTTSNPPSEGEVRLLRLNSAIKELALAQAEHNEWKSALPAIQEDMNDQLIAGKAEMEATFATAREKYAALTAGAQTFIRETEQKGMELEAKSEQLEAEVQARMAEACPEYQTTRVNVTPAPKGKAKPMLADIVGQPKATEESEKNPQQAEKEWKEFRKTTIPAIKPTVTWDNSTSKAPAKLTAEQMEEAEVFHQDSNWANRNGLAIIAVAIPGNRELGRGVSGAREGMAKHLPYKIRMYNISKLTDQCVEVLIPEQHATEARYRLRKAKYSIFRTLTPCYQARASQHQFEPQPQLTLNRWKYEAERAKTSEAKSYYQSLTEDYSDLLEQQKNSDEGPLMDTTPALAARQDTGSQHRRPASQMDAETDSAQATPAKRRWEAVNALTDSSEDCPPSESSETESMAGDTAKTVSNAMDMDQDSSYNTGDVDQNGSAYA